MGYFLEKKFAFPLVLFMTSLGIILGLTQNKEDLNIIKEENKILEERQSDFDLFMGLRIEKSLFYFIVFFILCLYPFFIK